MSCELQPPEPMAGPIPPRPALPRAAPFLVVFAGLLVCLAFLTFHPVYEVDTYLHLTGGRWILEHRAVPRADLHMYTAPGYPWANHSWLFQVVLYAFYRLGGMVGVQVMLFAVVAATLAILLGLWRRLGASPALAPLPFLVVIILMADRFRPRPELATWVLMSATLAVLLSWRQAATDPGRQRGGRAIWWVAVLAVPWANLHGGLLSGMLIGFVFVLAEGAHLLVARSPLRRLAALMGPALSLRQWALLTAVVVAMAAAALVNPYGFGWYRAVAPGRLAFLRSFIDEWQPLFAPALPFPASAPILLSLVVLLVASFAASRRLDLTALALAVAFAALTVDSRRNLSLFALASLPVMAVNLRGLRFTARLRWAPRACALAGALFGLAAIAQAFHIPPFSEMAPVRRPGFGMDSRALPIAAERFARLNHLPGRLFNVPESAGYLVWVRHGGRILFIDGLNAHGPDVLQDYAEIMRAGPQAEALLDQWRINTVFLPAPNRPDRPPEARDIYTLLAESPHWRLVFWDGVTVIYLRDSPANRALIERYGYRWLDPRDPHSPAYAQHRDDVAAELRRAIATTPEAPTLRILAGFISIDLGMPDQAVSEFMAALRLDPSTADAYTGLGVVALRGNKIAEAETMFREAARLSPEDPAPHRGLAVAQARQDPARSIGQWRQVVRRAPTSGQDWAALASAYEVAGEKDHAVAAWRKALQFAPDPKIGELARAALQRLGAP